MWHDKSIVLIATAAGSSLLGLPYFNVAEKFGSMLFKVFSTATRSGTCSQPQG